MRLRRNTTTRGMSPVAHELAVEREKVHRRERRRPTLNHIIASGLAIAALALSAYVAAGVSESNTRTTVLEQAGAQRDAEIGVIQNTLKTVCRAVPDREIPVAQREQCRRAERDQAITPVRPGPLPPPSGRGGPSDAQVRDAVAAYFRDNPPRPGPKPTTTEVTRVVASLLAKNPPKAGRAPSGAEIASAVSSYCAGGACRGPSGANGAAGATGPPPSSEDIAAAVSAYCAQGACRGPKGDTGGTGPTGAPGPTCPAGYELRPVVLTSPGGDAYTDAVACVRPDSAQPVETTDPPIINLPN